MGVLGEQLGIVGNKMGVSIGGCLSGPPPGPTVEQGIEQVLSASDSDVQKWINRNNIDSEKNPEWNTRCSEIMMYDKAERYLNAYSNYTLYELSPNEDESQNGPPVHLFANYSYNPKKNRDSWRVAHRH